MITPYSEIRDEVNRAKIHGDKFSSLHEAYGVILEEVDEVWDIARQKKRERSPDALKKELIQVAAMAIKALDSIENFVGGGI